MARVTTQPRKGVSLAKGPVGIIGIIGILYGLSALLFSSHGFALHIPHGAVHGKKWIGLEVNGWSDLLFIAAGLLLLLAAPLHWGAKSMSLLVGGVSLALAIIAIIRGHGVFGILAANHLTELVWAAAGVLLLILALLPRVGAREGIEQTDREAGATTSHSPNTRRTARTGTRVEGVRGGAEPGARSGRLIRSQRTTSGDEPLVQPVRESQDAGASQTDDNQSR